MRFFIEPEIMNMEWKCYSRKAQRRHQWIYEIVDKDGITRIIKIDAPHPGELETQRVSAQGYVLQEIKKYLGLR